MQFVAREVREGRIAAPTANMALADMMSLRGGAGALKGLTENPIPFGYMFAVNLLLYCWAISVGLFFAGFLSVYGSVAYALVVYIFFNLRLIGIQLSEPFGYEPRHLPVPEYLMRNFLQHRELLSDAALPLAPESCSPVDSAELTDFCAPFEAAYEKGFPAYMKTVEATKQMVFAQERFGFPGSARPGAHRSRCHRTLRADARAAAPQSPPTTATRARRRRRRWTCRPREASAWASSCTRASDDARRPARQPTPTRPRATLLHIAVVLCDTTTTSELA